MRIAYVINTLAIGGAERQIAALAAFMAACGHVVEIFALRDPAADELPTAVPVRHLVFRRNPASLPGALVRAARAIRAFRPDVIHSNNFHGNMLARSLRLLLPRARVISTIHNIYEGGAMRRLALRVTDPLNDHTAAVSQAAAEEAIRRRILPRAKCSVIANGIDCSEFTPQPKRRIRERDRAGLDAEFIWLAVGRIAPAKDYPNLLRAFAQVHAAAPDARLWIAGEGKCEYSEALHQLAQASGIEACIRWLGLRRDIPALLDQADGFVLSSAWEGLPLALGEAMAMEKPFVATDVGGVRELAGECGEIIPTGNPDALAAAMLKLMREPSENRQSQGFAARQRILTRFTIEESAAQWKALYQRVLASRRNGAAAN